MLKALRTEALRQFQEEGYYSPVDVIPAEEVREYRARVEEFEAAQGAQAGRWRWNVDKERHWRL